MNNVLKIKFVSGVMIMMAVFVGSFYFPNIADASYYHTNTLGFGSTGAQVVSLQKTLGVIPTSGYFGNITKRTVMNFQQSRGISASGVVDSMTGSAIANTYNNPFSEGCYSTVGYSTVTGQSCNIIVSSFPQGCTSTVGYSVTTGVRCNIDTSSLYPGCTSNSGFSSLTGASCMTGLNNSPLTGTAGELRYVKSISYENQQIEENKTDRSFAGYAITSGEDSDLNIGSIKITLRLSAGVGSDRLNKYAKTISVFCNGARVGMFDVASFAKSGNTYTKTMSLSGATIDSDSEVPLFLAVDTIENIDSSNTDNTWAVVLSQVRYTDADGANMTDSSTGSIGTDGEVLFHFLPVLSDDE